jgi:hypothetical protein
VATENKDQELETASVTLAEGMHFAGAIDGFHIDLDAEEYAGGTGAGPQPHRLLLLALAGCTAMDVISILRKKRKPGQWPPRGGPGEPGRSTSESLYAVRSALQGERDHHRSASGGACN